MHRGNQMLCFLQRIKISSILNQLWPLDLAHWIYADQLHFRRVLQCAHQIYVIMNHSIVTYMQCILAECVELLNMDGLQFPKRSLFRAKIGRDAEDSIAIACLRFGNVLLFSIPCVCIFL